GEQGEARDGGDRGERLAPETVGRDGEEIILGAQLAGRVPRKAQPRVLAAHARAVVPHAHEAAAALLQVHLDAACAGIQRVLDQLLDRCRGPLHHLAGGDLVGEGLGQNVDAHRRASIRHCQGAPQADTRSRPMPVWLAYAACCICWGSTWLAIKLGLRDLPPLTFAAARMSLATAVLLPFAIRAGVRELAGAAFWRIGAVGLLQIGIPYGLLFAAQQW